jgi:eukaryotic-like serine/threonine-protein kinase
MIRDVPDETQHVPDGPDTTRVIPDGPDAARSAAAAMPASTGPAVGSAPARSLPTFGRFAATAELGSGAMGTVYRAHDDVLGRDVAIKALHGSGELGVRERFVREARAIGAIQHPNILAVYDAGEANGAPYLVMELAGGGSLREHIKRQPLDAGRARELGIQIASALAAAHAASIIHRDVKPANILAMTDTGTTWKLADFGIARMPDSTLTMTGQFLGSPSYAAPESLRAGEFGPASDVYSLGATLYEAIAGTTPHGDHDMQSLVRKLETDPTPLSARCSVPPALDHAIMAALARDPARRPRADELAALLARADAPAIVPASPALAAVPFAGAPHAGAPVAGVPPHAGAALAGAALTGAPLAGAPPSAGASLAGASPTAGATLAGASLAGVTYPGAMTMGPTATTSAPSRSPTARRVALLIAALAIVVVVLAVRNRPQADGNATMTRPIESDRAAPVGPGFGRGAAGDPTNEMPRYDDDRYDDERPMVVDQYGNPVDEETAREILEQIERDARSSFERGRGKGRGKKKRRDD